VEPGKGAAWGQGRAGHGLLGDVCLRNVVSKGLALRQRRGARFASGTRPDGLVVSLCGERVSAPRSREMV
jgi:hypothetical protein